MALLTVQNVTKAGVVPSYSAVNSEDTFKINSARRHILHVKNGGGGSITVTIPAVKTTANVPGAIPSLSRT
jgi:hypothetical protein